MLLSSPKHSARDLEVWTARARADAIHARLPSFRRRIDRALDDLRAFAADGPCYAGVSWGKDSIVLAHMCIILAGEGVSIPMVWVRVEPIANPDCARVRDAAIARYGSINYNEIEEWCRLGDDGEWHATGTLEAGFSAAESRYGGRHISGIRGQESGERKRRMMRYGISTKATSAPIGWWSAQDVYAYMHLHDLPIHPAYACSGNGSYDRDRIRVASLGGRRGDGTGRAEWERRYYGDALDRIARAATEGLARRSCE